jgi:hypothetical protein
MNASELNTYDLLKRGRLVVTAAALPVLAARLGVSTRYAAEQ